MDGVLTTERTTRDGRVIDPNGHAVGGAWVSVAGGTVAMPEIARRTDAAGHFRIALPDGRFRIEASAPGGLHGAVDVDGGPGGEIVIRVTGGGR